MSAAVKSDPRASCTCPSCVQLCRRNPGWMTPEEARRAIDAGHAKSLMCDWLEPCSEVGNKHRIYVLGPASKGHGGDYAPEWFLPIIGKGPCVFHVRKRCTLHDSGLKPNQCRTAFACRESPEYPDQYEMAKTWDNEIGRETVEQWQAIVDVLAAATSETASCRQKKQTRFGPQASSE